MTSLMLAALMLAAPATAGVSDDIIITTCGCSHLFKEDTSAEAYTADTIAHEMGHNLGMCHDDAAAPATTPELLDAKADLVHKLVERGEESGGEEGSGPEYSTVVDFRVRGESDAGTASLLGHAVDALDGATERSWVRPCPAHVFAGSSFPGAVDDSDVLMFEASGLSREEIVHGLPGGSLELVASEGGEVLELVVWSAEAEVLLEVAVAGTCGG